MVACRILCSMLFTLSFSCFVSQPCGQLLDTSVCYAEDNVLVANAAHILNTIDSINQKNIIFDLTGVLFYPSKLFLPFEVGILSLAQYSIRHCANPFSIFETALLDFLYGLDGKSESHFYKQYQLPEIICQWQKGKTTSQEIFKRVDDKIKELEQQSYFKSNIQKKLIQNILTFGLNPDIAVEKSFKRIESGIELLKAFEKKTNQNGEKAHTLYLLSNLDTETFSLLQKLYPKVFKRFKTLYVSGYTGYMKPEQEAFNNLLKEEDLRAEDCFFIDDQRENIKAAEALGIESVQFLGNRFHL